MRRRRVLNEIGDASFIAVYEKLLKTAEEWKKKL